MSSCLAASKGSSVSMGLSSLAGSRGRMRMPGVSVTKISLSACKAVATEVHAKAREELGKLSEQLRKFGVSSVSLSHFSLGPPLKLGGVKVHDAGDADALVLDIDLRVAGAEPNAVVRVAALAGPEVVIQLAALQLRASARVISVQRS